MALDHASCLLIGTAVIVLLGRIVTAWLRTCAIQSAVRMHHAPKQSSFGRSVSATQSWIAAIPRKLLIGIALSTLSASAGIMPVALGIQQGPIGNALSVAARWAMIAGGVQCIRQLRPDHRKPSSASAPASDSAHVKKQ